MNSSIKLINVSTRQLLAFLEVTRLQSFAKAAEQVHLSPSGMSMLVKELEDQLGARLFERTTRSVSLTDAGRRLQPVAERIVGELRTLQAVIGGTEAAVRSRLHVAATPMVAASLLPEVLQAFARSHPQVRVQLADVDVGAVRGRVLEGEADLGLGFFVKPASGLVRQPLCKFRLMRIGPPRPGASGLQPSQPWSSLAGLPLVSLPPDNPIQALIEKQLARSGRPHEDRPRVNLIGTIIGMVRAGAGHAVIPSFALAECLRQQLDVALLREPMVQIELHLVTRRGHPPKPAAADFIAAVRQAATRLTS
ncbi:LysR family transcriptional regulator [Ramlibacter sp. AW1]|uniref:LysR family transcriptional regulator n=1 Tax=Ramlibacter aurantiacus TaxID=2801330 RepID=A0A936ZNG9_9BURK|nr:LysR family transcriptional regulator [Ramlibacter aurantiacus]MBL0422987.1 LysR family transcriptional regulator [Ramlibacter aurantiacus]